MPTNTPWSEAEQRRLLLSIIDSANIRPNWQVVTERMGNGFTVRALQNQYQQLRASPTATAQEAREEEEDDDCICIGAPVCIDDEKTVVKTEDNEEAQPRPTFKSEKVVNDVIILDSSDDEMYATPFPATAKKHGQQQPQPQSQLQQKSTEPYGIVTFF